MRSPDVVDSVAPLYAHVPSGMVDRQAQLRGARMRIRPLGGITREALSLALECHQARAILGITPASPDDPYVLPERWLEIDVDSEKDGYVVLLQAKAFDDAREVLERARRYAEKRHPR